MSLAEELLADLDDDCDEYNELEEEDELVDVNSQAQLGSDIDDRSVHALTKLNQSQLVSFICVFVYFLSIIAHTYTHYCSCLVKIKISFFSL